MGGSTTSEIQQPLWKSVLWRFIRVVVGGGIAAVVTLLITLTGDTSNEEYFRAILQAFLTGAITAAGLWFRDNFGEKDRSEGTINKLPL